MRYRPSDLVSREQRTPFFSLLIDIVALLLLGGISTKGLLVLFLRPTPDAIPVAPREQRAPGIARTYLKLPDLKTQMEGLAGLIEQGRLEKSAPLLLGAILTQIADARASGGSPEAFLAQGFRAAELPSPHTDRVRACVMMNWSVAHEFGLLTPENLEFMRRGDAPRVTVGSFRGETMEVVMVPVNDPHQRPAAYPKFVPARLAKSMEVVAQNEARRGPAVPPQRVVPAVVAPRR